MHMECLGCGNEHFSDGQAIAVQVFYWHTNNEVVERFLLRVLQTKLDVRPCYLVWALVSTDTVFVFFSCGNFSPGCSNPVFCFWL